MCRAPFVLLVVRQERGSERREKTNLITTPLHASHEENHASDAQEPSNEVNLTDYFSSAQADRVDSRRWEVEEEGHEETNRYPDSAK